MVIVTIVYTVIFELLIVYTVYGLLVEGMTVNTSPLTN